MAMQCEPDGSQGETYQQEDHKSATTKDQLLALVLSETLTRHREDPVSLIQSLRDWQSTLRDVSFGEFLCEKLVAQVLKHRFGVLTGDLPDQLSIEVSAALWNDPASRLRIERLWTRLSTNS